ncbi:MULTISPECIES: hypothetical protein [unclassified Streptomyces]|uniref:hypothetical protein n=1 Tax=unclassified Streptomyces TaxID=2593676 RepID=UPI002DD7DFE5|nr:MULTISPECIES: hypothetical protein [unclassified Streptomyces]WSA96107.1 hypothetical protein OIE63_34540 [Streptomyces sp. NBC_01795]WSB80522.1 hypothetical protein OHB04_35645 [Streptomyces sp. NBC_01775]WSS11271.1 hypothetical protein OG533_04610 [Streptomyces sp. NBC_01186]WSS39980.1 hypothetical protein OG220_04710 [Streptomyces sp. NBC_01187]
MPTDPFRAIAALARAEANRTTPKPRKPAESTESPESEPETEPATPERRRTVWRQIAHRIRRPDSA